MVGTSIELAIECPQRLSDLFLATPRTDRTRHFLFAVLRHLDHRPSAEPPTFCSSRQPSPPRLVSNHVQVQTSRISHETVECRVQSAELCRCRTSETSSVPESVKRPYIDSLYSTCEPIHSSVPRFNYPSPRLRDNYSFGRHGD